MKKIFSVDRIEGELAVCISDDDDKIDVPVSELFGMTVRDVFEATLDGDKLNDVVPMPEERDRRLKRNKKRLHDLARRNRK